MNEKVSPIAKRAVIVALCINLLAGAQYCWSMLGSTLMEQYDWTATQASLPYSVMMIVTSLWAIVVGVVADKMGPNKMIRVGAVCIAASLTIAGRTSNWWLMMFAIGILMAVASTSFTSNTSSTAVKFMPLKYKGLATGLVGAGMGWTSFYMAPMINGLMDVISVANTFTIIGVGCGVIIFILSYLLPNPIDHPELVVADTRGAESADHSKFKDSIQTVGQAAKTKETWILFFMFACAGMTGQMLTSQVTNIALVQAGLTDGYILVMGMGIFNGLGRLVVSSVSDRIGITNTWRLLYVVLALDMVLMAFSTTMGMLLVSVCIMGMFYGGAIPLIWATTTGVFGKKYVTTIYGIITNGFAVAALVGPTLASRVVDLSGGYTMAFYVVAAFQVIGFVLSFMIKNNYDK